MFWGGQCCETSAVLFMPALAHFGRFGAFSRQDGPTDRPDAERPVKRKIGKNKCWPVRATKYVFYGAPKQMLKNYENIFGN